MFFRPRPDNMPPLAPKPILYSATRVGQFLDTHYDKKAKIERKFFDDGETAVITAHNHPLEVHMRWENKKFSALVKAGKKAYSAQNPWEVSNAMEALHPYIDELMKWDYSLR